MKRTREAKLPVSNTLDEVSKAIDDVLLEVRSISSPIASQLGDRADEREIQEVIVQDTEPNMTPWDDGWEPTPELLVYWAEGNGAPKPFAYHLGMEAMFDARRDELLR